MALASTTGTNRIADHSLYARYRSESPLQLRQATETTAATVGRISGRVRREEYLRSIAAESSPTAATRTRPTPVEDALREGGFTLIRNLAAQSGMGTVRSGALFGLKNPLDTTAGTFNAALQSLQGADETDIAFRTAASWYRQAGPLRLQQSMLLPSATQYARQDTGGVDAAAILGSLATATTAYPPTTDPEALLYASTGQLYEQTPRLLNALFA